MNPGGHSKLVPDERELLPLNVLLHCRTVVEKTNFVTTGVMTHVEGELFEVEIPEFELFELGETVKLTVYSPAGIQTIQSIVFAKYEGAIAVLQPPNLQKRFKERREHPRIEISGNARVYHAIGETGEEIRLDQPLELTVIDISLSGLGFSGPDAHQINRNMRLKAKVEIGFGFDCELEIIRRERQEDKVLLGAKMHVLEPEMMRPLRAIILCHQVEKHAELRRSTQSAKRFNKG